MSEKISQILSKLRGFLPAKLSVSKDSVHASPNSWIAGLQDNRIHLDGISQTLSKEFKTHSISLETLISEIEDLKSACSSVVSVIVPQDGDTPMQFSYQLFKKSEDIIRASFDQFQQIFESVRTLKKLISEIETRQQHLSKLTIPLKMITVQYRITASKMDENTRLEFHDLADKLTQLTEEINTRLEKQFKDLSDTSTVCSTIIADLEGMVEEYQAHICKQLNASRTQIANLGKSFEQSHQYITEIDCSSDRLTESIFSIMVSMQAQDATSQKLEHICKAIDTISDRVETAESSDSKSAHFYAAESSRIQSNQLTHLINELDSATSTIRITAMDTQREIDSISKSAKDLSDQGSQTELLHSSAKSVQDILRFVETTIDKTRQTLTQIRPLREKFTDSTSRALNIASEMRMVAVNAQVYASNVHDGEALEVLSHSTQAQSLEAKETIESISVKLEQVAKSLQNAEESLTSFTEMSESDMEQLMAESEIAQAELQKLENDLPKYLGSIQNKRSIISAKATTFANKLVLNKGLREQFRESLGLFDKIADTSVKGLDAKKLQSEWACISLLHQNYTMQSEVDAHNEVVPLEHKIGDKSGSSASDCTFDMDTFDAFEPALESEESAAHSAQKREPAATLNDTIDDNVELF